MVWTSDYPEGRPGNGSGSASKETGKTTGGGSANSVGAGNSGKSGGAGSSSDAKAMAGAAVAAKPSNPHGAGSKSKTGSSSKSAYDPHSRISPNPISGFKQKSAGNQKPLKKPGVFLLFCGVLLRGIAILERRDRTQSCRVPREGAVCAHHRRWTARKPRS